MRRRKFQRIGEQVPEDLLHPLLIREHRQVGIDRLLDPKVDLLFGRHMAEEVFHISEQHRHRHLFRVEVDFSGFDFR